MQISFSPIGYIESPFKSREEVPIQPCFSDAFGSVIVYPEYEKGLKDLEGFSHVILLYFFDKATKTELLTKPFLDPELKGVFATRSPYRPNKIGLSVVKLVRIEKSKLLVKCIDVINNTPLIDIKPFVPQFDCYNKEGYSISWLHVHLNKNKK